MVLFRTQCDYKDMQRTIAFFLGIQEKLSQSGIRQEWKGKPFKNNNTYKTLLLVNYSYREKLALNNLDMTYAFRPELFSTFETCLASCTGRFHRKTLTVFWFSPQPALLWRHDSSGLSVSGGMCSSFCSDPASLPGFISGFGH